MTDPVVRDRPPTREELAEEIVDAILDRPFADPDDDLAKLARRFLRSDRLLAAGVLPPDTLNAARFCRYGHPTPLRDFCAQGHPLLEAASAAPGLREALKDAIRRVPGLGTGKIALLDSAIDHVFRSAPGLRGALDVERLAEAIYATRGGAMLANRHEAEQIARAYGGGAHGRPFYYECSVPDCTLDGHKRAALAETPGEPHD